jgi:hypothetical protein
MFVLNFVNVISAPLSQVIVADTENHCLRSIVVGMVMTLAGQPGQSGYLEGSGAAARFNGPSAVAVDPLRGQYALVADTRNHRIRRIWMDQGVQVSLVAGSGSAGFQDGKGAQVQYLASV